MTDDFWMVEFFAPWCGHCQKLAPEWGKAAGSLKGIVKFAAVNCDEEKELCGKFGVKGFPSIKLFRPGRYDQPEDYQGGRHAKALYDYAANLIPTNVNTLTNEKNINSFLLREREEKGRVIIYSPQKGISLSFKALSRKFAAYFHFGGITVKDENKALRKECGFDDAYLNKNDHATTQVLFIHPGGRQQELFTGKMKLKPLYEWLRKIAKSRPKPGSSHTAQNKDKLNKIHAAPGQVVSLDEKLLPALVQDTPAGFSVILFSTNQELQQEYVSLIKSKYSHDKQVHFYTLNTLKKTQRDLAAKLLTQFDPSAAASLSSTTTAASTLLVWKSHQNKYALIDTISHKNVKEASSKVNQFIEDLLSGNVRLKKLNKKPHLSAK